MLDARHEVLQLSFGHEHSGAFDDVFCGEPRTLNGEDLYSFALVLQRFQLQIDAAHALELDVQPRRCTVNDYPQLLSTRP